MARSGLPHPGRLGHQRLRSSLAQAKENSSAAAVQLGHIRSGMHLYNDIAVCARPAEMLSVSYPAVGPAAAASKRLRRHLADGS